MPIQQVNIKNISDTDTESYKNAIMFSKKFSSNTKKPKQYHPILKPAINRRYKPAYEFKPSQHSLSFDVTRLLTATALAVISLKFTGARRDNYLIEALHVLETRSEIPKALKSANILKLCKTYKEEREKFILVRKMPELYRLTDYWKAERNLKKEIKDKYPRLYDYYYGSGGISHSLEEKDSVLGDLIAESITALYAHTLALRGNYNALLKLATILNMMPATLTNKIERHNFVILTKNLNKDQLYKIRDLNCPGIHLKEKRRIDIKELDSLLKKEWEMYRRLGLIYFADNAENTFFVNTKWPEKMTVEKSGKSLRFYPFIMDAIADLRKIAMPYLGLEDIQNKEMLLEYIRNIGRVIIGGATYYPKDFIVALNDITRDDIPLPGIPIMETKGTAFDALWKKALGVLNGNFKSDVNFKGVTKKSLPCKLQLTGELAPESHIISMC